MSTESPAASAELIASAEITRLEAQIAKSSLDADAWRASGQQEHYLSSFLMTEALEARLSAVHARRAALRAGGGTP